MLLNFGAAIGALETRKSSALIDAGGYGENALQVVKKFSLFIGEQVLERNPEIASPLVPSTLAISRHD